MVPDLPYGRLVVPDDSEGPVGRGRFAPAGRSQELRAPSASDDAQARALCRRLTVTSGASRVVRSLVAIAVCTAVSLSMSGQLATADDLTDRRDELKAQLTQTRSSLNESSASLRRAALAVDRTQSALVAAEAALAMTRRQLAVATQRDQLMAAKLTKAQADLARAKAAVVVGQQKLDAQDALAGEMVRNSSTSNRPTSCRSRCWWRARRRPTCPPGSSGRRRCSTPLPTRSTGWRWSSASWTPRGPDRPAWNGRWRPTARGRPPTCAPPRCSSSGPRRRPRTSTGCWASNAPSGRRGR